MASRPGPEAAKQPQTITLPPPCLTVGIRGRLSDLGALSKFQVWGPHTITITFMLNPYFARSLALVYSLFVPSQPVISQPNTVIKPNLATLSNR